MYTDSSISETDSERSYPPIAKRQHHNMLERTRRNDLKSSFTSLKNAIPSLAKKNAKASRARILRRAIDVIVRAEKKRTGAKLDLDSENRFLEEQILKLQAADRAKDVNAIAAIVKLIRETTNRDLENETSDSEEDFDYETDDAENDQEDQDEVECSEEETDPAGENAEINSSSDDENAATPYVSSGATSTESESELEDESETEKIDVV